MKYTIELTENQKKQMDFMLDMANKHMGFNRKLEMIETTNVEDTNEYQIGYRVGLEDGKKEGRKPIFSEEEINNIANKERQEGYNDGYNNGLEDAEMANRYFYDTDKKLLSISEKVSLWKEEKKEPREVTNVEDINEYDRGYTQAIADYRKFERFFNSEGIEVFEDIRNTDGTISIDMILQYLPMPEIMARIKVYEEKKKAEEENIKVGDIIYSGMTDAKAIIISFDAWDNWNCIDTCGTGFVIDVSKKEFWERIGHIDEVEQLLDKLREE